MSFGREASVRGMETLGVVTISFLKGKESLKNKDAPYLQGIDFVTQCRKGQRATAISCRSSLQGRAAEVGAAGNRARSSLSDPGLPLARVPTPPPKPEAQ